MQIDITGNGIEISLAMRTHIVAKITHILNRFFDQPSRCHVILSVERHRQKAEVVVNYMGSGITASAQANGSMYAAVDAAVTNLRRRLRQATNRSNRIGK